MEKVTLYLPCNIKITPLHMYDDSPGWDKVFLRSTHVFSGHQGQWGQALPPYFLCQFWRSLSLNNTQLMNELLIAHEISPRNILGHIHTLVVLPNPVESIKYR
jgi:hypothetical protein